MFRVSLLLIRLQVFNVLLDSWYGLTRVYLQTVGCFIIKTVYQHELVVSFCIYLIKVHHFVIICRSIVFWWKVLPFSLIVGGIVLSILMIIRILICFFISRWEKSGFRLESYLISRDHGTLWHHVHLLLSC